MVFNFILCAINKKFRAIGKLVTFHKVKYMISLKRNSKGALVEATGVRSRSSSIYSPNQAGLFNISRSKFNDFLDCERCFYLDRVRGLISPSTPGWTLNETTDRLLKKEFDVCREREIPHRLFSEFGLGNVVPYKHESMDLWRDSLKGGLKYQFKDSNIVLHGGVDDIWFDREEQQLIVVDYKSQASGYPVVPELYLSGTYHQSYKNQLDFYAYLLINMGFDVSDVGYFYVCNADRNASGFDGQLVFSETLIPYRWGIDWIEDKVLEMIGLLNSDNVPSGNKSCENCAYARRRAMMDSELSHI